jgi:hypothetical protein
MEVTDENRIREIVREELVNFTPQKKKRAPNKWQLFLKDCVKEQAGEIPYTDKVKACSVKYKEKKNNGNSLPADNNSPPNNQKTNQ